MGVTKLPKSHRKINEWDDQWLRLTGAHMITEIRRPLPGVTEWIFADGEVISTVTAAQAKIIDLLLAQFRSRYAW
jgi:hypothetical protein